MKFIDPFRNSEAAYRLHQKINSLALNLEQSFDSVRIMEVCGSHTMAIGRYGIRTVLPKNIELISGPGCPVCVTDPGYIDAAIELAEKDVIVVTFGDMMKVPGSDSTLSRCRSEGVDISTCYSPDEALAIAKNNPDHEVVFLAIGFETTIGPGISLIDSCMRLGIDNLSLLTAFKLVPPALHALASDPLIMIRAFLCPAHVSAIIGTEPYQDIVESYNMSCVIAGFEPLDILLGIFGILEQLVKKECFVDNQYSRVVKPEGNVKARALMDKYLYPIDTAWRGIGIIPLSGLGIREEYQRFDAVIKHGLKIEQGEVNQKCKCGEILKGITKPPDCVLFGKGCTPEHPIGPCMVSAEGTCASYYKYVVMERV